MTEDEAEEYRKKLNESMEKISQNPKGEYVNSDIDFKKQNSDPALKRASHFLMNKEIKVNLSVNSTPFESQSHDQSIIDYLRSVFS